MRVGFLSYPMLFQNTGGLQVQIRETAAALERKGLQVSLVDPVRERLTDFDLIHIFSAINGNHRIAEQARADNLPLVVSPLIRPHWTRRLGWIARGLERLVGRATQWNVKTEFREIDSCLRCADALIALGEIERDSIVAAFGIPGERISVVPNGIPPRFFDADPRPFCENFGVQPGFVLTVATIGPHKNQMAAAQALEGSGLELVLIGPCPAPERPYLDRMLQMKHVRYIGPIAYDSALLCSAYTAAGVFCLPALSEVMPLSVMEALAAGTPVVMTRHHAMNLAGMSGVLQEVEPQDQIAIRTAVDQFIARPPESTDCTKAVVHFSWDAVATSIQECYEGVLGRR